MVDDHAPDLLAIRVEGALMQLMMCCTKRGITATGAAREVLERELHVTDPVVVEPVLREFEASVRRQGRVRPIDPMPDDPRPFGRFVRQHQDWYPGAHRYGLWGARRADLLRRVQAGSFGESDFRELDESSSCVVGLLANPDTTQAAVRGLVIGEVQSGKTGHMASVIAKAVDASFNVVIVLAGLTDVLRNQTQDRLDKDLFVFHDFDPSSNSHRLPHCVQWTRKSPPGAPSQGEVKLSTVEAEAGLRKKGWVLAVTKKNVRTINRLCKALERADQALRADARVLVIDDEADSASPHAPRKPEFEPAGINRAVRRLLKCFPRHSYVGYTATPYAVIFANPNDEEGFYPKDFIVALPSSSAYYGMSRIFGGEDDPEIDGGSPWALVPVDDEEMNQLKYRRDGGALTMPPSLCEALRYFVCATAERWRRGQRGESSTMLVHTTPYTAGHRQTVALVEKELARLKDGVGRGDPTVLSALESVWERESRRVRESGAAQLDLSEFSGIRHLLPEVLADLWTCQENSVSKERIRFRDEMGQSLRQIAVIVGGAVLSRGVTLEGLVASYFGRASDLYDALSQAGRWFGYRPGYEDLQRIWTTRSMHGFYRDIAIVDRDIRMQVRQLSAASISPLEVPVSVQTHDMLRVTSPHKMWFAENVELAIDGLRFETTVFDRGNVDDAGNHTRISDRVLEQWERTRQLFSALVTLMRPRMGADGRSQVFDGVPFGLVIGFLRSFPLHPADPGAALRDGLLSAYARRIDSDVAYAHWNVALIGVKRSERRGAVALASDLELLRVNRARRKHVPLQADHPDAAFIKQLSSATDVAVDLPEDLIRGITARNELLRIREAGGPFARPLLAFYAIDRGSRPRNTLSDQYSDLAAASDLVGYMIVNPCRNNRKTLGGLTGERLAVRTAITRPELDADETISAELQAQDAGD